MPKKHFNWKLQTSADLRPLLQKQSVGYLRWWPRWSEDRVATVLCTILMVYLIVWMGTLIRNNLEKFNRIGRVDVAAPTVTVDGSGTVSAAPNIANVQVGLLSEGKDVAAVQSENATKMNALLAEYKQLGIASGDLQTTSFSINPKYDYKDGRSTINGFQVSQSVTVKVRDLSILGQVFAKAATRGANQVYGPTFTLDDEENLKSQARAKALAVARAKLAAISRDLGVRPVRLVGFTESSNRPPPGPMYARLDVGGPETVPNIEPGEMEIAVNVSVTYEVQ